MFKRFKMEKLKIGNFCLNFSLGIVEGDEAETWHSMLIMCHLPPNIVYLYCHCLSALIAMAT